MNFLLDILIHQYYYLPMVTTNEMSLDSKILSAENVTDVTGLSDVEFGYLLEGSLWGRTRGAEGAKNGVDYCRACAEVDRLDDAIRALGRELSSVHLRCYKCSGDGQLSQYRHVSGGTCFRCGGSGVEPTERASGLLDRGGYLKVERAKAQRVADRHSDPSGRCPFELMEEMRETTPETC